MSSTQTKRLLLKTQELWQSWRSSECQQTFAETVAWLV
jgi:hypothetical protein